MSGARDAGGGEDRGAVLLDCARRTIAERFGEEGPQRPRGAAWLDEPRAVFVTLTEDGALRGCIGQLAARQRLWDAVRDAAESAAFRDPRFPPLARGELDRVHVEISVLTPLTPMDVQGDAELLATLRPGVDGLWLSWEGRSAVFIPEVWKELEDPKDFLAHLKRKAGLSPDREYPGMRFERFQAEVFDEPRRP